MTIIKIVSLSVDYKRVSVLKNARWNSMVTFIWLSSILRGGARGEGGTDDLLQLHLVTVPISIFCLLNLIVFANTQRWYWNCKQNKHLQEITLNYTTDNFSVLSYLFCNAEYIYNKKPHCVNTYRQLHVYICTLNIIIRLWICWWWRKLLSLGQADC